MLTVNVRFSPQSAVFRHEYQRRGLGGMLVAWGCRADEMGLRDNCEASPEGLRLYLRHVFEEVGRITVDLELWGGKKGELIALIWFVVEE